MKLKPGQLPSTEALADTDVLTEEERWLRCAACGARVTKDAWRVAMNGAHEHAFMNPSGLRFSVQCFSQAPGCRPEGERSTVWTWFPGFAWQVEVCRGCHGHLGWSFHASTSFYGLVRDALSSD